MLTILAVVSPKSLRCQENRTSQIHTTSFETKEAAKEDKAATAPVSSGKKAPREGYLAGKADCICVRDFAISPRAAVPIRCGSEASAASVYLGIRAATGKYSMSKVSCTEH